MDLFYLLITGVVGGFFAGLLGIGGGIIYIAVLPYALREYGLENETLVAVVIANSILATFFAALLSLYRQYKNNNLHIRDSLLLGIPGSTVVILAYAFFVEKGHYQFIYFNILIIVILLYMLVRYFIRKNAKQEAERKTNKGIYLLVGSSGGILSAFSGLGGGAIVVPLLLNFTKMDIKKATSISMGFILVSSFAMSVYNLAFSKLNIDGSLSGVIVLPVVLPLILGVIIAAPIGVNVATKISSRYLTILFIGFILLVMTTRIYDLFT